MQDQPKPTKVLITGSRTWVDYDAIYKRLAQLPKNATIIEGGASGADTIARTAAYNLHLKVITVLAQWHVDGRSAGPKRNRRMLDMEPDIVLAFRRDHSSGTTDCIEEARRRGIPVEVVDLPAQSVAGVAIMNRGFQA